MREPLYRHTQTGPLALMLLSVAIMAVVAAILQRADPTLFAVLLGFGLLLGGFAACFHRLVVEGDDDGLQLTFGPLPLFRKRLAYDTMTEVEPGRTAFIDGLGIHYVPGRGWTYNLWGAACVRIRCGATTVRVGTDDPEGLAEFLRGRLAARR